MRFSFSIIYLLIASSLYAQFVNTSRLNPDVEEALSLAKTNRQELEKVLVHYSAVEDSLQFKAACYLIANMKWHHTQSLEIRVDSNFSNIIHLADSMYYNIVQGKTSEQMNSKATLAEIEKIRTFIQDTIQNSSFSEPSMIPSETNYTDLNSTKASFLIDQIDNAFSLRKASPLIMQLSFQNFCDYVLPYRILDDNSFRSSGKDFKQFFSKYIGNIRLDNIPECIASYNITINNFRHILGNYPFEIRTGFEELLFNNVQDFDCFSVAQYGYASLNSVGIPVDMEYNASYKLLQGRHCQCNIADGFGSWTNFSPESAVPRIRTSKFDEFDPWLGLLNLYRIHFAKQKNNPYDLKAKNEYVPSACGLDNPCIEDVTAKRMLTVSLRLPFNVKTTNHLVYLATFNSATGFIPVTWGLINQDKHETFFKNVIPDRLYFPIYYDKDGQAVSFGRAFYLKLSDSVTSNTKILYLDQMENLEKADLILTRKFPQKPHMEEVAVNLVGTYIVGSNDKKFNTADTLLVLKHVPVPNLQDVTLNNNTAYKYYKIEAPLIHHNMNISEIMFLTDKKYNYKNTTVPIPLPITEPREKNIIDTNLVWVLDTSIDVLKTRAEYDGSMETAPSAYPSIFLRLKKPEVITTIRFSPLNANNGINPGNEYALFFWNNGKWEQCDESQIAEYNYIQFKNVPKGKLYWLRNLTRGKEEAPFVINEKSGKQLFIYTDIH